MYEGTHRQNGKDLSEAGTLNGEKSSSVKITQETAIKIKELLKDKYNITEISNKLDVPYFLIQNIKRNKTWIWLKI